MIIQQRGNTYKIERASEGGWMYYIFNNQLLSEEEIENDNIDCDDGGHCTSSFMACFRMAGLTID